jgi:hypothetical protein
LGEPSTVPNPAPASEGYGCHGGPRNWAPGGLNYAALVLGLVAIASWRRRSAHE